MNRYNITIIVHGSSGRNRSDTIIADHVKLGEGSISFYKNNELVGLTPSALTVINSIEKIESFQTSEIKGTPITNLVKDL